MVGLAAFEVLHVSFEHQPCELREVAKTRLRWNRVIHLAGWLGRRLARGPCTTQLESVTQRMTCSEPATQGNMAGTA